MAKRRERKGERGGERREREDKEERERDRLFGRSVHPSVRGQLAYQPTRSDTTGQPQRPCCQPSDIDSTLLTNAK